MLQLLETANFAGPDFHHFTIMQEDIIKRSSLEKGRAQDRAMKRL